MHFIPRFFTAPKGSFFLFGPRGTGKSTWLKQAFPEALWINLLEPEQLRFYGAFPERLRETLTLNPKAQVVVIDEVQNVPELLPLVHAIIEEKRGIQFILTGSSARKLKRVGVDLLAGRAILKRMHPFFAAEIGVAFDLERALEFGLVPLIYQSEKPQQELRTYAALYLKEEVQAEGLVRRIGDFARFMEVMSFSHGGVLNTANISRECAVKRKTVENYLQILEDLMLAFTLPVFTKRAQRGLSAHDKFYFFDTGVFRSLRPKGPLDLGREIQGPALEGLVAQHLKAWVEEQEEKWDLSFWRTRSGLEVDFVVYGPKGFWAIEVKNGTTASPSDVKGLEAFREDYPESQQLLLYRGRAKTLQKGILCVPCAEFLANIRPDCKLIENVNNANS